MVVGAENKRHGQESKYDGVGRRGSICHEESLDLLEVSVTMSRRANRC